MRRQKGAEGVAEAEGGGEVPDNLRCRRSGGSGWRCPTRAMAGAPFCEKHIQQRLHYQAQKKPQITLNGGKKQQLCYKAPKQPQTTLNGGKKQQLCYKAPKKPQTTLNGGKKQQLKRSRVKDTLSPCRNKKTAPVRVVNEQEKQRIKTEAHSTTGKRKISEDIDCSSRSTTTEKETNFTAAFEVDDVASQSTRQTNGKFRDREIGRYLRKYLASGVMEIALDYDSDYDFRKVAGLELSQ